jgi:hypothetical protein
MVRTLQTTNNRSYRPVAVVRTNMCSYYATTDPEGNAEKIEFKGVNIRDINGGYYPEPAKVVVTRPYTIEFC